MTEKKVNSIINYVHFININLLKQQEMLVLAYDKNYQKITVDTADVKISPNGTGLQVKTYPGHSQGSKENTYQGYLSLARSMSAKDRTEFETECKRILADARAARENKRANVRAARKAVLAKN